MRLVALRHVGSSWSRDRTCVPCIGRQILNHWITREALGHFFVVAAEEGDAIIIKWVEARDKVKLPTVYKTASQPQPRITSSKMSIVPRLRNAGLKASQ